MTFARWLSPLLLLATVQAHGAGWTVAKESSLRFTGTAQGEAFEGRFHAFDAKIAFDPANLAGSKFEVTIDLASADSQNEERDQTLEDTEFFDVASHPKATYFAKDFVPVASGFEARGTLTLRGVAKPVALLFTWTPSATGATLEGKATLDRMQFGVGGGDWEDAEMIAHEVKVATTLVLTPAP